MFSVIDEGALEDRLWNYDGDTYAPDFDLYLWDWDGFDDPGQTLATLTTSQIETWNEPCWSNAEYDRLAVEQASDARHAGPRQLIHRMQQIIYEQTPGVVTTYPETWRPTTRRSGPAGPE